jgi:outer membrane protein insertion porin family
VAATLLIAALALAPVQWDKAVVERVTFRAEGSFDHAEIGRVFGVKVGSPLSRVQVRAGLQALIASRLVEDASVTVEPEDGGVAMTVELELASRVSGVHVDGLPRSYRRRVKSSLGLTVGGTLLVPAFVVALNDEIGRLHDDGYPDAALDPDLQFDVAAATVAVTITGSLGEPVRLDTVESPSSGMDGAEILDATRMTPGMRLSRAALNSARSRLARALHRRGFWQALVEQPEVTRSDHTAKVRLNVELGPKFALQLKGIKSSKGLESAAFPFIRGEESFDEAALDLLLRKIRVFLQDQGRLLARASAQMDTQGDARLLTVTVEEGPVTPIRELRFPGLTALPESALRPRIGARTGHPWRWGGEPVDEASLDADSSSILGTLQEAGYASAKVGPARIVKEGDGVAIEFPITEGSKRTVAALDITGVPADVALGNLPLAVGGPWSAAAELQTANQVRLLLQDGGYPDARVAASEECGNDTCSVKIVADAGDYGVLGRVAIAGLARTRPTVVRKVADLVQGRPAGPGAQLDAQRRLLGLGIFQRVTVSPIPGQESGPETGVLLDVAEADTRAVSFGLGWDTQDGVRGSVSWSQLNLFGSGWAVGVDLLASRSTSSWQVTLREPAGLALLGVPTWIAVYRSDELYTGYPLRRRGMWIELGDRLRRPGRFLLRYDYQIVDNTAPADILSPSERDKANIKIASVTPTLEWDTRDDLFAPRRGLLASLQAQFAFKLFSADSEFEKVTASVAGYEPALGGVLAASLRAGAIQSRGSSAPSDNLAVPVAVRFFAGGRISQRAFPQDLLGILGQTLLCPNGSASCPENTYTAVGGAGLLLANLEWRFPIAGPVGGDVFLDGGNDWASWRDVQPAQMRWGAGLGLRIETPVGPFRVEYGWKLDRLPGESPGELFVSLGNPF